MGALPGGLSDMKAKRLLRKLNYLPRWAWYLASLCVGGPIGPVAVYLVFHVLEKAAADEIEETVQEAFDWNVDIDEGGADLLFQLVSTRYEQRSTIITTNVGITGWAKVFGDEVAASAIADRICHHCHVIKITGRSYRLKDVPTERKMKEE